MDTPSTPRQDRGAERATALCFLLTVVTGLALLGAYVVGVPLAVQGILLALCLGGLGAGIVVWAQRLIDSPIREEPRHLPAWRDPQRSQDVVESLREEAGFSRRRFLVGLLAAAVGSLAAALAIPILSLGPAPGRSLFMTAWRAGSRVVDDTGEPVVASELPLGSLVTIFPAGAVGSADSQAVLIHVDPTLLQLPPEQLSWAPEGFVAYSKICTHAGCPVGLYREQDHALICPCHQSTFDVLAGAVPTFGPAARPLPQLPISLQPDGTFVALGDFPEPVGPSFWDRTADGSGDG